jgi:hypothetical protein
MNNLNDFLKIYAPDHRDSTDPKVFTQFNDKVPLSLIELWNINGFGKYNKGLIEIINPNDYFNTLYTWLGKEVDNYIPIAISGFGDLFYYRKLSVNDEDVCILDPHYRKIFTCTWDLSSFFNKYLCDLEVQHKVLRKELFEEAVLKFGHLGSAEIFMFVPALAMGGTESIKNIKKGNSVIHLDLLFQL